MSKKPKTAVMMISLPILAAMQFRRSEKDSWGYSLIMRVAPFAILGGLFVSRAISITTVFRLGWVVLSCLKIGEEFSKPKQPKSSKPPTDPKSEGINGSTSLLTHHNTGVPQLEMAPGPLLHAGAPSGSPVADGTDPDKEEGKDSLGQSVQEGDTTHVVRGPEALLGAAPLGEAPGLFLHAGAPSAASIRDRTDPTGEGDLEKFLGALRKAEGPFRVIQPDTEVEFSVQSIGLFPVSCGCYSPLDEPTGDMGSLIQAIRGRLVLNQQGNAFGLLYYEVEMAIRKVMTLNKTEPWPAPTLRDFLLELLRKIKEDFLVRRSFERCAKILYMTSRMILDSSNEEQYPVLRECYEIYHLMPEGERYEGLYSLGAWMNIVFCFPFSIERNKFCQFLVEQEGVKITDLCIKHRVFYQLLAWAVKTGQESLCAPCKQQIRCAVLTSPSSYKEPVIPQLDKIRTAFIEGSDFMGAIKSFMDSDSYASDPANASYQLLMLLIEQYESIPVKLMHALIPSISPKTEVLPLAKDLLELWIDLLCLLNMTGYSDELIWLRIINQIGHDAGDRNEYIQQCGPIICSADMHSEMRRSLLQNLYLLCPSGDNREMLKMSLEIHGFDSSILRETKSPRRKRK